MSHLRPLARALLFALVVAGLSLGCAPEAPLDCLPHAGELPWDGLRHVVAAREDGGVRVRGFSGAVPSGSEVSLRAGETQASTLADESGRFDIRLSEEAASVRLRVGGESATLRVRELEAALACVPAPSLPVGTTPNDLVLSRCGEDLLALVPTSTDGALESVLLAGSAAPSAIAFPPAGGRPANPWSVALHEGGALAAVTLFGQHAVALVEPCSGRTLQVVAEARDAEGEPLVIEVNPPVELSTPQDADGDGTSETRVRRMRLTHPEGVAFVGDRLLVGYTNLLEVGPPARFGPGVVVAFALEGEQLRPVGHTILPFQNPQAITLDAQGRPWVSCSGALERGAAGYEAASDGGLLRLEPSTLEVEHAIALERFAPATPAITRAGVVVGSLVEGKIALLPPDATSMADGTVLFTGAAGTESLFDALDLGGGLALAAGFTTDALLVVDVVEGALHPWPFTGAIALGTEGQLFRGLQALARAPAGELPTGAPDAAALFGLSSEVVPLRLWQVMGP